MKKLLLIPFLLLFFSTLSQAQDYWRSTPAGGDLIEFYNDEIWVADADNLFVVNQDGDIVHNVKIELGLAWSKVNDIVSSDDALWLATDIGLFKFNSATSFLYYGISGNSVLGIDIGPSGDLYAGNLTGLYKLNQSSFELVSDIYEVHDLEIVDSKIFVKTYNQRRVVKDGDLAIYENGNWNPVALTTITSSGVKFIQANIRMQEIESGKLLFGSQKGYVLYSTNDTWEFINTEGFGINVIGTYVGAESAWHISSTRKVIKRTATDTSFFSAADGVTHTEGPNLKNIILKDGKVYVLDETHLYWAGEEVEPFVTQDHVFLDANKISARVNALDALFFDRNNAVASFELDNQDVHAIFASSIWLAGVTDNGEIKGTFPTYSFQAELSPGTYNDGFIINKPNLVKVTKEEVEFHKNNYNNPGYKMPWSIENWPGSGDESIGELKNIAPFVDVNGDEVYTPSQGDYPSILGDQMIFLIMNDSKNTAGVWEGRALGVEVHFTLFSWDDAESGMDKTMFMNYHIINRSERDYVTLHPGFWVDFDLGNAIDDFIGSDKEDNIFYAYNGDAFDDEEGGPSKGFGENSPAVGVKVLCEDMHGAIYYNIGGGITGDPNTMTDVYNYLNLKDKSGTPFMENGVPVEFMFSGDPVANEGWTETIAGNAPGDRRMVGVLQPKEFKSGESLSYTFAIGYARENTGNYLNNINFMKTQLNAAQDYLQNKSEGFPPEWAHAFGCSLVGIDEEETHSQLAIFPNPSSGLINVESLDVLEEIRVIDIAGKVVYSESEKRVTSLQLNLQDLKPGVYLLKATLENGTEQVQKLTIE